MPSKQFNIRIPDDLIAEIAAETERVCAETRLDVSQAAVFKLLLREALDARAAKREQARAAAAADVVVGSKSPRRR